MVASLPYKHRYFSNYPVENAQQALWFSKELTLPILELLWKAGPKGLTPLEVVEHLKRRKRGIGKSIVYQTLRGLYELEYVDREWDNVARAHRNVMKEEWPPAMLDDDFEYWVEKNLGDLAERILYPAFQKFLEEATKLARSKRSGGEFIPTEGESGWCKECGYSHQADFFFLSLLWYASNSFTGLSGWKFNDKELGKSVEKLYESLGFADPGRDESDEDSD